MTAIRKATAADLDALMDLMIEVQTWLKEKGVGAQWPPVIPRGYIAGSIEKDDVYLVYDSDQLVATLTLQWEDRAIWGDVDQGDAGYIHRLAIRRTHAGRGLGAQLLLWAAEEARSRGKRYLRLDCWADNPTLVKYYREAGFTLQGEFTVGDWRGCKYERRLQEETVHG